ncbi:MAG TPA: sigma-70 family RNA polymerase sigma factor [Verrucomicrobiae bacterium]|nr:sigma-70 family RNA polymerase sigma factor [Verrucomicrobiae bacterium]
MNGTALLAEFREGRSEDAFRELVLRYTNLVFSAAKRRVSNASLAGEIAQIVFVRLAKAAPKLRGDAELVAWLHRTTVHASIDLWRSENRRRNREQQAVAMQTNPNETVPWNDLAPVLDDAVNDLSDAERQAIVLRFFDDKSMRDVGATLGVSENAAKMRVSRALDRLRNLLSARGVACGALALGAMLAEHSVEAAPAPIAATLATLKIPAATGGGITAGMLTGGIAALLLVGTVVWLLWISAPNNAVQQTPVGTQANASTSDAATAATTSDGAPASKDPDPLWLLQAVGRARERINSGIAEYYCFSENTYQGPRNTNHLRLAALFDGSKLRFESIGREYSYVGVGKEGEASAAKMKELGLDQEGAVQAGLLTPFESHHVVAYDGSVVMDYWETDKKSHSASIKDPDKDSAAMHFDPRMLGITAFLRRAAIDLYLGYQNAKSIKLLGKELVEDKLAWRVSVVGKYDQSHDFWLDVDHPTDVLKHAEGSRVVLSKYDGRSPIPVEVIIKEPKSAWHLVQTNGQFNIAVEPTSFTLAGLGMQIGADVIDYRNHRRIGYWTGNGLSDDLPKKNAKVTGGPRLSELMALLEQNPTSHFALESAIWINLNTPDGPEVEKSAEVILQEHIESPELFELCKEQIRVRHRSSKQLLQALLDKNPNSGIKAMACFNLATLAKDRATNGLNNEAKAEADKLFERVIREFPKFNQVHNATRELDELRRMSIGNQAPDIEGVDLEGQPMRLSDYRGKVVLVYFWGHYYDNFDEHHKLIAAMDGKPFALIGVNCDEKPGTAKAILEKHQIAWPSFFDGVYWEGPIHAKWQVRKWPSTYILDKNGIIRYRDLRGFKELQEAVNSLLPQE